MPLAAQGLQNKDIARQLGIGRVQVARWRARYLECGLQGIEQDLPHGAPPVKRQSGARWSGRAGPLPFKA
ncbi:MAG: helix-turn-helix domain-containing protein [Rubrivivax sp.]|nr:helix-turn-helix domain-containing protein [Rubrivivax sp.]